MHRDGGRHDRPEDVHEPARRRAAAEADAQEGPGVDAAPAAFAGGLDAAGHEVAVVVVSGEVAVVVGGMGDSGLGAVVARFEFDVVGLRAWALVAAEEVEAGVGGGWWFGSSCHAGGWRLGRGTGTWMWTCMRITQGSGSVRIGMTMKPKESSAGKLSQGWWLFGGYAKT